MVYGGVRYAVQKKLYFFKKKQSKWVPKSEHFYFKMCSIDSSAFNMYGLTVTLIVYDD